MASEKLERTRGLLNFGKDFAAGSITGKPLYRIPVVGRAMGDCGKLFISVLCPLLTYISHGEEAALAIRGDFALLITVTPILRVSIRVCLSPEARDTRHETGYETGYETRGCDGRVFSAHMIQLSCIPAAWIGDSGLITLERSGTVAGEGSSSQEAWLGRCAILSVLGLFHSTSSSRLGDNWRCQGVRLV